MNVINVNNDQDNNEESASNSRKGYIKRSFKHSYKHQTPQYLLADGKDEMSVEELELIRFMRPKIEPNGSLSTVDKTILYLYLDHPKFRKTNPCHILRHIIQGKDSKLLKHFFDMWGYKERFFKGDAKAMIETIVFGKNDIDVLYGLIRETRWKFTIDLSNMKFNQNEKQKLQFLHNNVTSLLYRNRIRLPKTQPPLSRGHEQYKIVSFLCQNANHDRMKILVLHFPGHVVRFYKMNIEKRNVLQQRTNLTDLSTNAELLSTMMTIVQMKKSVSHVFFNIVFPLATLRLPVQGYVWICKRLSPCFEVILTESWLTKFSQKIYDEHTKQLLKKDAVGKN